jgi:putative heme iron utilization protein
MSHSPFPATQHQAVTAHLADEHAAELLLLARAFGGGAALTRAVLLGFDQDGIDLLVGSDGANDRPLWVPFPHRLTTRAHLDREFALLVRTARHTLGLPPDDDPT